MDCRQLPSSMGNSGGAFLEPELARERLFERILDQLADSGNFSSGLSPTIFVVYAHNNEKEGNAYDDCVRKFITWLEHIHAQILSDHSSLPPFVPGIEGTDPVGNILGNQMCLLPPSCYGTETPKVKPVDKVIVCGSEVLEAYCREPSAWAYTNDIARICTYRAGQPTEISLESAIRQRVEKECDRSNFHHVLTELAFLQARKSGLPNTHSMVPVVLSQTNPDESPMQYLPVFWNTDVKLKLSSPAASALHKLFFKLLKRLFPDDKEFIQFFRECYDSMVEDLRLNRDTAVAQDRFNYIANQQITKAYQRYWKLFCMVIRDGKLEAYAGKLSHQVSQVLEDVAQSTQHEILQWLSPNPAANHHGKYHDLGTSRMEGTCDWIIQHDQFRRWYAHESSALLFLRGKMGTGKTYSTSRVIDWIGNGLETNANDEAFAYFYCNKQDLSRSEPKEILRNIIRQLATGPWKDHVTKTAVHKTVCELWREDKKRGILSTFAMWEACLLELIDTYPRTTIVLDALDECSIGKREALINLLLKLANRGSHARPVKIFVAARPEDDIRRHLGEEHVILMQDKHNAADIGSFIRTKISEHPRWFKMKQDFQEEVVETLMKKSGDMFLFASLQIQRLLNCDTQIAMRKRLSTLPDSLKTTYEDIVQSATTDPDEKRLLQSVLRWVMYSARPLTTRELLFAVRKDSELDGIMLQIDDLDEDLMMKWTRNLLHLEDSSSRDGVTLDHDKNNHGGPDEHRVWRLAHQAVAEFLESSKYCDSGLAHLKAGKVCLTLLLDTFSTKSTEPRGETDEELDYIEDFECPCGRTIVAENPSHSEMLDPLAEYAVYGWPTHVRAHEVGLDCNIDGLSQTLQQFLGQPDTGSPAYKRWLHHAFRSRSGFETVRGPEWSIFGSRWMPAAGETMCPTTLACHLGIYTCLSGWWDSPNIDYDRIYDPNFFWAPNLRWSEMSFGENRHNYCRWSLVAVACVHNEIKIIKHLLGKNVRVNTKDYSEKDDVPPIVAAAVSDSVETVKILIEFGADIKICTSFTDHHGHVLRFAIGSKSLAVMRLLLQRPELSPASKVEEVLKSISFYDFRYLDTMKMLLEMGVSVNTRLSMGTLLDSAIYGGWDNMVCHLLEEGAEMNEDRADLGDDWTLIEAAIHDFSPNRSTVAVLIKHKALVDSRVVSSALKSMWMNNDNSFPRLEAMKDIIHQLLECKPDLNETWTPDSHDHHGQTSALIEAVKDGDLDHVRFLFEHGADVNLHVEGEYCDALSCVFQRTLKFTSWVSSYPVRELMDVLVEKGASLQNLEDARLNTALAAAAFAGLEDLLREFLDRGADPNAECGHQYHTALGAAAASDHPRALTIVHTLLNNGPGIKRDYGFFQTARLALDAPLWNLAYYTHCCSSYPKPRAVSWLESASVLAVHHAVWDIDLRSWEEALKSRRPDFWKEYSEALVKLQDMLANNRTRFFLKFPGAESDQEWCSKNVRNAFGHMSHERRGDTKL